MKIGLDEAVERDREPVGAKPGRERERVRSNHDAGGCSSAFTPPMPVLRISNQGGPGFGAASLAADGAAEAG
jgi:hypothetical protein